MEYAKNFAQKIYNKMITKSQNTNKTSLNVSGSPYNR
jgi:hypothetical protein